MNVQDFITLLGADFFVGVPDSKLRPLCDQIWESCKADPTRHVVAANEGNAAGIAAGYHLATGRVPLVYLQNSGLGNVVNPAVSLLSPRVYGIPVLFVVGWRGEPGLKDEPQHIYQGEISQRLLEDVGIEVFVLEKATTARDLAQCMEKFRQGFAKGRSAAILVREGALEREGKVSFQNSHSLLREDAIRQIAQAVGDGMVVATTGKAGRELYELRESLNQGHGQDFLCVGSMGHASSIALGLALHRPKARIWCLDGDGALIMHAGAMPVIAQTAPRNLVHIVINNGAHESVGGMPCAADGRRLSDMALACGYPAAYGAGTSEELATALEAIGKTRQLGFLEVFCALRSRKDLGRPKHSPEQSRQMFMAELAKRG